MRDVQLTGHALLREYIDDEIMMLFPLHVINSAPDESSMAIIHNREVEGFAISGIPFGIFEVPGHWAFAKECDALAFMLKTLITENKTIDVNFEERYCEQISHLFPDGELSKDIYYSLTSAPNSFDSADYKIVSLDYESLPTLNINHVLKKVIGRFEDFPVGAPFWGVVDSHNKLVAIGEAFVRSKKYASIQQVYCHKPHRKHGVSSMLLSHIASELIKEGLTPTYLVSEDNLASIKLAEKVGFTKLCSYGHIKN